MGFGERQTALKLRLQRAVRHIGLLLFILFLLSPLLGSIAVYLLRGTNSYMAQRLEKLLAKAFQSAEKVPQRTLIPDGDPNVHLRKYEQLHDGIVRAVPMESISRPIEE